MIFPDLNWWQANVWQPDDAFRLTPEVWEYYRNKAQIAAEEPVAHITEIGVRFGYSAAAFLCAYPQAHYFGIDLINGGHGGVGGGTDTFPAVRLMLAKLFPEANVTLVHFDSRQLTSFPPADLFHVDADHDTEPAYRDIEKAFNAALPGNRILVDDYTFLGSVKQACDRFRDRFTLVTDCVVRPSLRGDFLIRKLPHEAVEHPV